MGLLKQSTARNRAFKIVLTSDHTSPATGKSPTVNISKDCAAFGAAAGTVTEIANGWYKIALTTGDTGTLGDLAFYITAAACDDTDFSDQVVAALPGEKVAVTLAAGDQTGNLTVDVQTIKTQTVTCAAGVTVNANVGTTQPVNFTGTGASALVKGDAIDWNSVAVTGMPMPTYTQPTGFLAATFPAGTIANQTNITGGIITTATNLTNAPTAGDFTATMKTSLNAATPTVVLSAGDSPVIQSGTATAGGASTITIQTALGTTADIVGCKIKITGGTGANQERIVTGYVNGTKVVTVNYAWVTQPDNTSVYTILFDNAPKIDANLKVSGVVLVDTLTTYTGNTVQTGDSYARIGSAGAGLTAVVLASAQTFNNTGTWTGNIVGTLSTLTTYTGNTPQTGDSYAIVNSATFGNAKLTRATVPGTTLDTSSVAQTGDSFARLGAPAGASIAADLVEIEGETDGIAAIPTNPMLSGSTVVLTDGSLTTAKLGTFVLAKTTNITGFNDIASGAQMDLVNAPNATAVTAIQSGLSKPGTAQKIDGTSALAEDYAALHSTTPTIQQILCMIYESMSQFVISGTTITGKKLDGTTNGMVWTLDSSSAPTQRIRTG